MKDEELFLNTEFSIENIFNIQKKLIENGWIFVSRNNKVTIYESDDDENWEEEMCQFEENSYDESLLKCLNKIKEYYKRVL